ncbi:MAG: ISAs1 family transposase [Rhodospirillales bacterium]|nr:ISAs1 family transposase [Rhodospirillales bacterium]
MSSSLTEIVLPHRPPNLPPPALVTDGDRRSLFVALEVIEDPRDPRGRRYPLVSVLAAAVCAVLAGACTFAAVSDWVRFQDRSVWARLGFTDRVPAATTVWRLLIRLDAEVLSQVLARWLRERAGPVVVAGRRWRLVIAVDGKVARGARLRDGRQVHLLSAYDTSTGIVLAQVQIAAKSNEIPAFTPLLRLVAAVLGSLEGVLVVADALHAQTGHADLLAADGAHLMVAVKANQCATRRSDTSPLQAGQTRREACWVRWLTWIRKVKGTRACQETGGRAQMPETACRETRAVWRRLDCLNPNLQRQQFTATGKASETGVRRVRGVLVHSGQPSRRKRYPTRAFKEMSGAPAAALLRVSGTNVGSPSQSGWRCRSAHSSRRSHARPRRTGKPFTGRRGAGDADYEKRWRYA